MSLMNEEIIEIDQIKDGHVVLAIPTLRLIVIGRTLEEARAWARSAIAHRGLSMSVRAEQQSDSDGAALPPSSHAA
jgi:hypothetical protein